MMFCQIIWHKCDFGLDVGFRSSQIQSIWVLVRDLFMQKHIGHAYFARQELPL